MSGRRIIVAGNWKMNLNREQSIKLAQSVADAVSETQSIEVAVFPSILWTVPVADSIAGHPVAVGIQDCYFEDAGAFTGEVSPQAASTVVSCALIGHSERRHVIGEPDDLIVKKLRAVLRTGMTAYLCVGETLEEREAGDATTVTTRQLAAALNDLEAEALARVVIAYEPVWAIGTGVAATPDDAQEMCRVVRGWMGERFGAAGMDVPVLYGGSVNPDNATELFCQEDIDGGLIGGASLDAGSFTTIMKVAADLRL